MGLVLHKGSRIITREELAALPPAPRLGNRHNPIPHTEVVETILDAAPAYGLQIAKTQLGLSPDNARLFGLITFDRASEESALALGFRTSTDESFAVRGVAGRSVFVCDNLALSGDEFVFSRKHTTFARIINVIRDGFSRFLNAAAAWDAFELQMKAAQLSDRDAAEIFAAFLRAEVIPDRRITAAVRNYYAPGEFPDCQPRTVWGLHNAITRTLRESSLQTTMTHSSAASAFLGQRLLAA